jgi:hypothetical protein
MRFGLDPKAETQSQQRVAEFFGVTRNRIREIEAKALRKLRHPSRSNVLKEFLDSSYGPIWTSRRSSPEHLIELVPVIEKVKKLEPSLIAHLRNHSDDLIKIDPIVFEQPASSSEHMLPNGFTIGFSPGNTTDVSLVSPDGKLSNRHNRIYSTIISLHLEAGTLTWFITRTYAKRPKHNRVGNNCLVTDKTVKGV